MTKPFFPAGAITVRSMILVIVLLFGASQQTSYTSSQIFWIGTWGPHLTESPETVKGIRNYRAKLKAWLTAQFNLIEQGKASDIHVAGAKFKDPTINT
jgi:hypothetical protein